MNVSRRDFGKMTLAGLLPLRHGPTDVVPDEAPATINSRINGVQIGSITYSFRALPNADDILKAYVAIGLGEMELMSNHAEALAGAPQGEALTAWRTSASEATFKPVRQKIADAGIDLRLLCFNMNVRRTTDEEIEYAFMVAKWLGVKAMSTSTQVSMAKRIAPFADTHKLMVGFHGHSNVKDPDEVATVESFTAVMAASKYHGVNLDVGHFTAANGDSVAFINAHHARITNLHLKDRKRDQGATVPWGEGDAPLTAVLKLLQKNKWDIPANIEFEYRGDPLVEVPKCLQYCRQALA